MFQRQDSIDIRETVVDRLVKQAEQEGLLHVCAKCGHARGFLSRFTEICEYCDEQFQLELSGQLERLS